MSEDVLLRLGIDTAPADRGLDEYEGDLDQAAQRLRDALGTLGDGAEAGPLSDLPQRIDDVREAARLLGGTPLELEAEAAEQTLLELERRLSQIGDGAEPIALRLDDGFLTELRTLEQEVGRRLQAIEREAGRADPLRALALASEKSTAQLVRDLQRAEQRFDRSIEAFNAASRQVNFDPLSASAQRLRQRVVDAAGGVEDAGRAIQTAIPEATSEGSEGMRELERSMERAADAAEVFESDIRASMRASQRAIEDMAEAARRADPFEKLSRDADRELRELVDDIQRTERAYRKALQDMEALRLDPNFDEASREAEQAERRILQAARGMVRAVDQVGDRTTQETRQASEGYRRMEAAAREAREEIQRVSDRVNARPPRDRFGQITKSLGEMALAAKAFIAAQLVDYLRDIARVTITTAADLQTLDRRYEAITGSQKSAAETLDRLRQVSDLYGGSLDASREKLPGFLRSLEGTNLALDEQKAIYEAVNVAAAGAGAGQQKFERAIDAVQQIAGKGVVSMEELRGQLAEAIPGALSILARELGLTIPQLNELVESGTFLAEDALPALAEGLVKAYGPGAVAGIEEANNSLNDAKNIVEDLAREFGDELLPLVRDVVDLLKTEGANGESLVRQIGEQVAFVGSQLVSVLQVLNDLVNLRFDALLGESFAFITRNVQALIDSVRDLSSIFGDDNPVIEFFDKVSRRAGRIAEDFSAAADIIRQGEQAQVDAARRASEDIAEIRERLARARENAAKRSAEAEEEAARRGAEAEREAIESGIRKAEEALARELAAIEEHEGLSAEVRQRLIEQARQQYEEAVAAAREAAEEEGELAKLRLQDDEKARKAQVKAAKEFADEAVKATEKAVSDEVKAIEKREKSFEQAGKKLAQALARGVEGVGAGLAGTLADAVAGATSAASGSARVDVDAGGATQSLDQMRDRAEALRREIGDLLAAGESVGELTDELGDLQRQISDVETGTVAAGLRDVGDAADEARVDVMALASSLVEDSDFLQSFTELSQAGQDAVADILDRLSRLEDASPDAVRRAVQAMADVFESEGVLPQGAIDEALATVEGTIRSRLEAIGRVTAEEVGKATRAALLEILGDDVFRDAYRELTDAGRSAVDSAIEDLTRLSDGAQVRAQDVAEALAEIGEPFRDEGLIPPGAIEDATSQLSQLDPSADAVRAALDRLSASAAEAGARTAEAGARAAEGAARMRDAADQVQAGADAQDAAADAVEQSSRRASDAQQEQTETVVEAVRVGDEWVIMQRRRKEAVDEAAQAAEAAAQVERDFGDALAAAAEIALGVDLDEVNAGLEQAGQAGGEAADGAERAGTALDQLATASDAVADVGESVSDGLSWAPEAEAAADAASSVADETTRAADGMERIGQSGPTAAEGLTAIGAALSQDPESLTATAESLTTIADGVLRISEAQDASTVLTQTLDALSSVEGLAETAQQLAEISEAVTSTQTALESGPASVESYTAAWTEAQQPLEQATQQGIDPLAEAAEQAGQKTADAAEAVGELATQAGEVATQTPNAARGLDQVDAAARRVQVGADAAAGSLGGVADEIERIVRDGPRIIETLTQIAGIAEQIATAFNNVEQSIRAAGEAARDEAPAIRDALAGT